MDNKIRVRFAPSPTGPLHIGGLRTALFNYLFAKKNNGDFLVRIEDTDQARYVPGSEQHILDSLSWCGISPDEGPENGGEHGPYRQSERGSVYEEYISILISKGGAYYAFDSKEELEKERKLCEKEGETFIYNASNRLRFKNSLSLCPKKTKELIEKQDYVVRFKTPEKAEITCYDVLRGKILVDSHVMDDKVLFKTDRTPTYHFANVVDDNRMEISHVIRGEEWLPSLALHWLLYDAFDWKKPKFIHLPLILKPSGKGKLSKRDGDKFGFPIFPIRWKNQREVIEGYKEKGFLAEATVNFLALLGWNPGTDKEIFSLKQLESEFSLKKLNNSGARFDPDKNLWFNHQHIQLLSESILAELLESKLIKENVLYDRKKLPSIVRLIKPRIRLLTEIFSLCFYFFEPPKTYNAKVLKKLTDQKTTLFLLRIVNLFVELKVFDSKNIKNTLENSAKDSSLIFGKVLGLIRLAIIGELSGADLFQTMELIGKKNSVKRISDLASFLK
jgi:glutamyl-tRNA synthetase